jgi:hypothetical protein
MWPLERCEATYCAENRQNHFVYQAKRSTLLDLACMTRCSRDVKSRVASNLDHTRFRGIESPLGLLQGKSNRLTGSRFGRTTGWSLCEET